MEKQYAGEDLVEIRAYWVEQGFTEVFSEDDNGFDLWKPFDDAPAHDCSHVVVWKREDGGFWAEEY